MARGGRRPGHPYLAGAPLLVAHRGGAKLAPENTLAAFHQAVSLWRADMLELDVRLSADGRVVVIHDASVDRTTDGSGRVRDLPWAALRELDAGYRFVAPEGGTPFRGKGVRISLLDEVLEELPLERLNVESKSPETAGPLARVIERHGATHRVLVAAQRDPDRVGARTYHGPWGSARGQIAGLRLLGAAPRADILQVPERWHGFPIVTPAFVACAHRLNLPVQVWTVDDPAVMLRLLGWGVDGIQSDRPDLLAAVLTEVAGRTPPPGHLAHR